RRQHSKFFKSRNESRSAVRIAAVIYGIDPNKNISGTKNFSPRQAVGKKDSVSRRDIRNWNALSDPTLWHRELICESGSTKKPQVYDSDAMFVDAKRGRDSFCGLEFD